MEERIDFGSCRVTVVTSPIDGRFGFNHLAEMAKFYLGIDIFKGEDFVVFLSLHRTVCKIIHADKQGITMITRYLHKGRFEQFLKKRQEHASTVLSAGELADFLNGIPIYAKPEGYF